MLRNQERVSLNQYKQGAFQAISGATAGFVELSLMHPLDLIKTRFQLQNIIFVGGASDSNHYSSLVDCCKKLYAKEGLASFWKGVLPPLVVETPKKALVFFAYEQLKKVFLFGSPVPTTKTFALAGLSVGAGQAFLINPFEVVKVTQQANRNQAINTWVVTREIIRKDGLGSRGLYRGLTATMARNGIFATVYFGFYNHVKGLAPEARDIRLEVLRRFSIAFVTGCIGCVLNTPFDVAKSRIQGPQPVTGQIKYKGTVKTIKTIYDEEGFMALYKGFSPKILRLGTGAAIVMVIYEYTYEFLKTTFPN